MTVRSIAPKDREELLRHVRLSYWRILNRLDSVLERSSLTARQFLLLSALAEHGALNARKLGELLSVTPADVTGLTGRLERKGLVRRLRSEADRRLVILELTETGTKSLETARRDRDRVVDALITSMSPQEFRMMLQGLSRVIHSLGGSEEDDDVASIAQSMSVAPGSVAAERGETPRKGRLSRRTPSPDVR